MTQLITTLLSVLTLLVVPLGVVQVHTVMQMKMELADLSFSVAKFISNHGGSNDQTVDSSVRQFIQNEIAAKQYDGLRASDIDFQIRRNRTANPTLWSHEDEFTLMLKATFPRFSNLFPYTEEQYLTSEHSGTVNIMEYDITP
ncbi:hypothetical protein [Brevibacillus dissolubilis]|uniref:hypothetical protein n=1 Tax=Brevibacillus dissolubilis TaxID=1844116 RepID=UPI0011170E4C|nr:hypothetical protein [Brevibacillus dissolubilis]